MAAIDDNLGPDLDQFSGCKWTDWQQAVESEGIGESSQDSTSSSARQDKEVATLKREDLGLFGFCPAKDHFYLVVCEHCRLPFKPQTFHYHIEKHHGGKTSKVQNKPKTSIEKKPFSEPSTTSINHSVVAKHKFPPPGTEPLPVEKRPDHKKISEAIKNAFDKASMPNSKSKNPVFVDHRHSSAGLHGHETHSGAGVVPIKEQLRTRFLDEMQKPLSKKLHKPNRISQEKLGKPGVERLKKPTVFNKSHHHSMKHTAPHTHQPPNKVAKLNTAVSKDNSNPVDKDGLLAARISHDPEVVIKKLPISDTVKKEPNFPGVSKPIPSSSDPLRQYKHNHNPQIDIVKTVDRGPEKHGNKNHDHPVKSPLTLHVYPVKSEKNVPLKAREYDPNKHCGVRTEPDNMPCTRSLTCKTHALRHKRKVPGRRKNYDELVNEQAKIKQKLKEQAALAKLQSSATSTPKADSRSVDRSHHSLPRKPFVIAKPHKTETDSIRSQNQASMHEVKTPPPSPVQPPQKNKNAVHLFPRATAPRHIDCWKDAPNEHEWENVVDPNQHYISHHPNPLAVNSFNGWLIDNRLTTFSRNTHHPWRTITNTLKDRSSAKSARTTEPRTALNFNPIPSTSIPESLKRNSDHQMVCSCADDISSLSETYYAMTPSPACTKRHQRQSHNFLLKSSSIDNSALSQEITSNDKFAARKQSRSKRNTVDYISSSKSPKHLSQVAKDGTTLKTGGAWSHDGALNITTSANHITSASNVMDLSALLSQGSDQFAASCASANESVPIPDSVFKIPNDVNALLSSGVVGENASGLNTTPRKRNLSGKSRRNSLLKSGNSTKHEASPLNGLSSSAVSSHKSWSHGGAIMGSIGAVMQQNTTANNNSTDTANLDTNIFTQGPGKPIEQGSYNSNNNSTNFEQNQTNSFEMLLTTSTNDDTKAPSHSVDQLPHDLLQCNPDIVGTDGQTFELPPDVLRMTQQNEQLFFSNEPTSNVAGLWKS
uniref:Ataxin-7-like n=1 Tax=Phallusia mammillata TaxID=59560 RepID=A0A6F9D7W2_9ASCI|nr:ataxin-7-like [Phallusia mammillata]